MIKTDEMIPRYYNKRDFKMFFKLLEFMLNSIKKDIEYKVKVLTPEECPDEYLPLLGSRISYEYKSMNSTNGIDINRFISKYYYQLRQDRGTLKGILEAVRLVQNYLSNSGQSDGNTVDVFEDSLNPGSYVIITNNAKLSTIIREVMDIVRPIGFTYTITEYSNKEYSSNIGITDSAEIVSVSIHHTDPNNRSEVVRNDTITNSDDGITKINNVEDYKSFEGQVGASEVDQ